MAHEQWGHTKGTSSPIGVIVPDYEGQLYSDTENKKIYISTGLTSSDWEQVCGGPTDIHLKISDLVESVDGTNNNVDVDRYVDTTNGKVGKRTTGNADNQDCDFDALFLLPSNFSSFDTNAIEFDVRASDITGNNDITVRVYGTNNVEVGSGFDLTPTSSNTWQTKFITAAQLSAGTFTAGQMFRIRIHITVDNADTIDISNGEVKLV